MGNTKLHITVPLLDELENLPQLFENIRAQDAEDFKVFFCVNQPDDWWNDEEKKVVCEANMASMEFIQKHAGFPVVVIDKSSKGKAWMGKQLGVGWARKVVMDAVLEEAGPDDIIITLDGDTTFNKNYFSSILENFRQNPDAVGLSVPYYHPLSGSEAEDRAILRYEIYMRHYAINIWRIANPYHFTALGSAMAVPVSSYKAIGGMTPKRSGEDFYFLQKLVKYGKLLTWNEEKVYPAARFSDRVFFGTGPAMIKGSKGDWDSYPVYHKGLFDQVKETYDAFTELYDSDRDTPIGNYLSEVMNQHNIWAPLRKNSRTVERFRKACTDKIDGLRVLQFLKHNQTERGYKDAECLIEYFENYRPDVLKDLDFLAAGFNFDELSVEHLNEIRNILVKIEEDFQRKHHHE
ncbi:MAG: hypothetical protein DRJ15_14975 [Bacteroidetes bacterium]|nr:MAG: hypothetical protein DRJ15_14975 [Bacteroidota bacterium]